MKYLFHNPKGENVFFCTAHIDITKEEFRLYYSEKLQFAMQNPKNKFVIGAFPGGDYLCTEYLIGNGYGDNITIYYSDENLDNPFLKKVSSIYCPNINLCDEMMIYNSNHLIGWVRPGKLNSHTEKNIRRHYGN